VTTVVARGTTAGARAAPTSGVPCAEARTARTTGGTAVRRRPCGSTARRSRTTWSSVSSTARSARGCAR
jgi:hypothetical protein